MLVLSEPGVRDPALTLRQRAAEAVEWCLPRASVEDPQSSLRQLPNPKGHLGLLHGSPGRVVHDLCYSRAGRAGGARSPEALDLSGGRLLVYFPAEDLADGAAEEATRGFFDVDNTPPWDSWIAFVADPNGNPNRDFLLAYVPPVLTALVERGLWANPEECILWLENAGVSVDGLSPPA